MHILQQIARHKALEVAQAKRSAELAALRDTAHYSRPCLSLATALRDTSDIGIIAEHKRKSPSKPTINLDADPRLIVPAYIAAGAAGVSILTDSHFFGGKLDDIIEVRDLIDTPILRKDFLIDPYQIVEAKSIGADVILLISELLDAYQIDDYSHMAHDLGLEVLLEMHSADHLHKIGGAIDIVGINNRDLTTFETDIQCSLDLIDHLPQGLSYISESGLRHTADIVTLRRAGFDGFLIGEALMATPDPGRSLQDLIHSLNANK